MPERTSSTVVIGAPSASVMEVISDLAAYPEWAASVKTVEIHSVYDDEDERPAEATFVLDAGAIKDTYRLLYTWEGDREVRWSLVEADILTSMEGAYRLTPVGPGQTGVEYELTLEVKIPLIGLLRRKAEKVIIDTALKELKKRVEG